MERLINSLKSDLLTATCPECYGEFLLLDALLFDGLATFPEEAEQRRKEYEEKLVEKASHLEVRRDRAEVGAARTAKAVGIGKMVEHLVPILEGFPYTPHDCRTLFNPIDMVVFNGLTHNEVKSLIFMEIKSGKGRLNRPQRLIRDAIENGQVEFEEV